MTISPPLLARADYQVLLKQNNSDRHSYNIRQGSPISLSSDPGATTGAGLSTDELVGQAPNHCQEKPHYLPEGDSVAEHDHR